MLSYIRHSHFSFLYVISFKNINITAAPCALRNIYSATLLAAILKAGRQFCLACLGCVSTKRVSLVILCLFTFSVIWYKGKLLLIIAVLVLRAFDLLIILLILLFLSIQNMTGTCPKRAVAAITDSHNLPNRFKQWERPYAKKSWCTLFLQKEDFRNCGWKFNSKQKPELFVSRKKCNCVVVTIFLLLYLILSISLFYFIVSIMHWNTNIWTLT